MEKILNQEEIDALFAAARTGKVRAVPDGPPVQSWDIRQAGQTSKEQVRAVTMFHEGFARNLSNSLGAFLRIGFEVNLVSVEQLPFYEFLQRVPEMTYVASVLLHPLEAICTLQVDISLAFPMIDLLLGGPGKDQTQKRDLTEVEEEVFESVVHIICRDLQIAWQPLLGLEFSFEQRRRQAEVQRLMPPTEKILALSFEIRLPEARGMMNLAFSGEVSSRLLRRLAMEWSFQRRRGPQEIRSRLRSRLAACTFPVELVLPDSRIRTRDLISLKPGEILPLPSLIDTPAVLKISGREVFLTHIARTGSVRAGQIGKRIPFADNPKESQ